MKKYVNAKEVLPEKLIKEIQQFVEGTHLYIPRVSRVKWGTTTKARDDLDKRNMEILMLYEQGLSINELALQYNLSEQRIRSILYCD